MRIRSPFPISAVVRREHHQPPDILHPLELGELTGIGGSMEARLRAAGIMGDKLHLDAGLGGYLAGVTVYSTIFGKRDQWPVTNGLSLCRHPLRFSL